MTFQNMKYPTFDNVLVLLNKPYCCYRRIKPIVDFVKQLCFIHYLNDEARHNKRLVLSDTLDILHITIEKKNIINPNVM